MRNWWQSKSGGNNPQPDPEKDGVLPGDSVVTGYAKKDKIGEGTFGKVYKGVYNGKPCAVKVFKDDVLKESLAHSEDRLKHRNVVQIYGMWYDPHKGKAAPSIMMELCDESLLDFIKKCKGKIVPKDKKLLILRDIARGMVHLHSQEIIHGDLRSSNVLLCYAEDKTIIAKVADFDMTSYLDLAKQNRLNKHSDEDYFPPEIYCQEYKSAKEMWALFTREMDVFCFGVLVLEMALGSYPTPDKRTRSRQEPTEIQRRDKHLAKLKQTDKETLGLIIRKCLIDAPEGRPSFIDILKDVEGHLPKQELEDQHDLERLPDKPVSYMHTGRHLCMCIQCQYMYQACLIR